MCGIAGIVDYIGKTDMAICEIMRDRLKRRGPDQDGFYSRENVDLIHTRLAVVDVENGLQPMIADYGGREYCVVYNGELYNTDEVRALLIDLGHRFESRSDTEVLLKAYVEWGENCVDRFNGIYAFAVWEQARQRLFVARDRMGVKPFFYFTRGETFIFGSELKALLAHPLVEPVIDTGSVAEIMLIGPGRTPGYGVFKGVSELKAGWCGYFSRDGLRLRQYWKLEDGPVDEATFGEAVEKVRWLVLDAIDKQLVSDVPICTFLSGGLDSSIISAAACRRLAAKGQALDTFSVDYEDNDKYFKPNKFQPDSDSVFIDRMREFLGLRHHRVVIDTPELVDALYEAVLARDLPGMADVDASLLLFCRQVKKYATVALSGECADEIFGGYPWFRDETIRNTEGFPWAQSTLYRMSFVRDEFAGNIDAVRYVDDRYRATVAGTPKAGGLTALESRMKEMTCLNLDWFMQTLLDRKDRMSMYSGLEVRVPFCDHRIVEYLYRVPWEWKNYCGREKGILRAAMEGVLPDEILWRKKSPYPITHNPAYLRALSGVLRESIGDPGSPLLQIAKRSELEKLLETSRSVPWYGQLMTTPQTIAYFIQIDHWMRQYGIRIV